MVGEARGVRILLAVGVLCAGAGIAHAARYQKCFAYEAGPAGLDESAYGPQAGASGAWAMVTDAPAWGGCEASLVDPGWPDQVTQQGFVFGPEDNSFVDDGDNSTNRHAWGLVRSNLSQISRKGYTVLGDATLTLCVWWNGYHDGGMPRTYLPESAGLWEIPAGKIPNSNALSQGSYTPAHEDPETHEWVDATQPWEAQDGFAKGFREASVSSITSAGTDMWLPIPGSTDGALSLWDGVMGCNTDREGQAGALSVMTFVIPQATVQGWLDDPASHNGLVFAAVADDIHMRNGGIRTGMDYMGAAFVNNVNTLQFDYTTNGDAGGDGLVTDADYTVWADTYLSQDDLRADFSCDGQITDADYTVWADHYGTRPGRLPCPSTVAILSCLVLVGLRDRPSRQGLRI
jgi:hypothetical protein